MVPIGLAGRCPREPRLPYVAGLLELEQRAVFVLFEVEGYSGPEIAEMLDCPLATAYSRLRLARAVSKGSRATQRLRIPLSAEGCLMTDPTRLLHSRISGASRRALEAAIADEPTEAAKARVRRAMSLALPAGVLVGVTTTSTASAAMGGASGAATGSASAVGATVAAHGVAASLVTHAGLSLIAAKAIAVGLGLGLAANVGIGLANRVANPAPSVSVAKEGAAASASAALRVSRQISGQGRSTSATLAVTSAAARETAGVPAETERAARVSPSHRDPDVTPTTPAARVASELQRPAPVEHASREAALGESPAIAADALREESALLVRARQALARAEFIKACALVQEHRQRFGAGALQEERDALEVRVLAKMGRGAEARGQAQGFLARYPRSPQRESVRAMVGAGSEGKRAPGPVLGAAPALR
jgi:hypothetical protein